MQNNQQTVTDIPLDPANLSPALAAMTGILIMPKQYARIMQDAVISVNSQCALTTQRIMK